MERKSILLVEGVTDKHVVLALCAKYNLPEVFTIQEKEGIDNLIRSLRLMLSNPSAYGKIGVVVDADSDAKKRYSQIVALLKTTTAYDDLDSIGDNTIISPKEESFPSIGIWIMPDNSHNGMVEDFALSLVPKDDILLDKAKHTVDDIEKEGIARFKPVHHSKALIHTYLAWQEAPGMPIGQAITKHALNPDADLAKAFVSWLNDLFCK